MTPSWTRDCFAASMRASARAVEISIGFSALVPWMAEISTPEMARAAPAWVSVMLPPPTRPMWKVMLRSGSMIRLDELFVSGFGVFGGGDGGRNQDAVAEGDAGIGGQGEIQLFLAMAENFLA